MSNRDALLARPWPTSRPRCTDRQMEQLIAGIEQEDQRISR